MRHGFPVIRIALAAGAVVAALLLLAGAGGPSAALAVTPTPAPVAHDAQLTIASTTPPQPVTVTFDGSDSAVPADHPAFAIVAGPHFGTLSGMGAPSCTVPAQPPTGQPPVLVVCTASVDYTPNVGAAGLDAFTYAFSNGGVTSAPATVTVYLPASGGLATFDRPLTARGINPAVWTGGTVAQLAAATLAAGGMSVTTFDGGKANVLIPGAPPFARAAFDAAYPSQMVLAGTIVFVAR